MLPSHAKCLIQLAVTILFIGLVITKREQQNRWKKLLLQSSERPVPHSITAILTLSEDKSILLITEGRRPDQQSYMSAKFSVGGLYFFDPSAQSWLTIPINSEKGSPPEHAIQTATSFPKAKGKPVVFLGIFRGKENTTTWRLETSSPDSTFNSLTWRKGANFPHPNRFGYSAVAIQNKLLVWGGMAEAGKVKTPLFNDLFAYDVDEDQWSEIKTLNENPFGKAFHSAVAVADRYMIILGGKNCMLTWSDKGYVLDVVENVWLKLPDIITTRQVVGQSGLFNYNQFYDWILLTLANDCRKRKLRYEAPAVMIYRFSLENVSGGSWIKVPIPKYSRVLPGLPAGLNGIFFNESPVLRIRGKSMAVRYSYLPESTSSVDDTLMCLTGDSKQYHWELLPTANDNLGPLAGHSLTLSSNGNIYVYGGFSQVTKPDTEGVLDGSSWRLDVDTSGLSRGVYRWEKYLPENCAFRAKGPWCLTGIGISFGVGFSTFRSLGGHSSVGINIGTSTQKKNCFIIYGGIYRWQTWSCLLFVCPESFYSKRISRVSRDQTWPPHRAYHSAVLIDQATMIVFGGIRQEPIQTYMDTYHRYTPSNDMWSLNWTQSPHRIIDEKIAWTYMGKCDDVAPRFGHTAVLIDNSQRKQILVFGGNDEQKTLDDLWQFTLPSGPWKRIHYTTDFDYNNQLRLRHHTAVRRGRQMIIYGGCRTHPLQRDSYKHILISICDKSRVSDRLFSYDVVTQTWKMHLAVDAIPRYLHGMVLLDSDHIVIFGGINNESKLSGDVFTIQPGCNMGEEGDFFTNGCRACDVGYYSSESGPSCERCSLFFSTNSSGSTSADYCSVCSGICSYGGKCTALRPNVEYKCECVFPFSGNTCGNFWPLLAFGASLLVAIAVATLIYKIVQYVKRARRDAKDLREKEDVIVNLLDGWRIEDDEVNFVESRRIGKGGFGEVWLAEYREMDVAVKILNENERLFVSNSQQQFQQEIDFMRNLRHPNIVLFLGAGSFRKDHDGNDGKFPSIQKGNLFLVTEYVKRGSLHGVLMDSSISLTVEQQLGFCLDSAKGMQFLHELSPPRIHRDLKAANLLVSQNWVVKVSDFGTARRLLKSSVDGDGGDDAEEKRMLDMHREDWGPDDERLPLLFTRYKKMTFHLGTSLWKAPELLKKQAYGASVDVYSFGIVIWEIFSRRRPYEDNKFTFFDELVRMICERGVRPALPSRTCPSRVISLMKSCWHAVPFARPTFRTIVRTLADISKRHSEE